MKTSRGLLLGVVLAAFLLPQGHGRLLAQSGIPVPWHNGKESPARVTCIVEGYGRNMPFKNPSGICLDRSRNEIYVADTGNHQIAVFDMRGTHQRTFTHFVEQMDAKGKLNLQPGEPKSVAVNSRGDLFVVDSLVDYLDVLDYRGRSQSKLWGADLIADDAKNLSGPVSLVGVTVDGNDQVYVGLGGHHSQIVVLDKDLQVIRRIGRSGKEKGGFAGITGIFVAKDGKVIVTDGSATPVQVFSSEGDLLLSFGKHEPGWENFSMPNGVVCDKAGNIWIADSLRQVITIFDAKGKFFEAVGGLGSKPGELRYPSAMAGDGNGLLVVLEKVGARFQVFELRM